jgi:hypothetical protein
LILALPDLESRFIGKRIETGSDNTNIFIIPFSAKSLYDNFALAFKKHNKEIV